VENTSFAAAAEATLTGAVALVAVHERHLAVTE
jgi:hypothetical protein